LKTILYLKVKKNLSTQYSVLSIKDQVTLSINKRIVYEITTTLYLKKKPLKCQPFKEKCLFSFENTVENLPIRTKMP